MGRPSGRWRIRRRRRRRGWPWPPASSGHSCSSAMGVAVVVTRQRRRAAGVMPPTSSRRSRSRPRSIGPSRREERKLATLEVPMVAGPPVDEPTAGGRANRAPCPIRRSRAATVRRRRRPSPSRRPPRGRRDGRRWRRSSTSLAPTRPHPSAPASAIPRGPGHLGRRVRRPYGRGCATSSRRPAPPRRPMPTAVADRTRRPPI